MPPKRHVSQYEGIVLCHCRRSQYRPRHICGALFFTCGIFKYALIVCVPIRTTCPFSILPPPSFLIPIPAAIIRVCASCPPSAIWKKKEKKKSDDYFTRTNEMKNLRTERKIVGWKNGFNMCNVYRLIENWIYKVQLESWHSPLIAFNIHQAKTIRIYRRYKITIITWPYTMLDISYFPSFSKFFLIFFYVSSSFGG